MTVNRKEGDVIHLDLAEVLKNESIITHCVADRKTRCLDVRLNHVYSDRIIISRIYPDWVKTIDTFGSRAGNKGISKEHIMPLADTLDNNYKKILEFIYGKDETKKGISALALVNEKVVDLFLDETKIPYAAVKIDEHVETIPIESNRFEDWVCSIYYHYMKDFDISPAILSKQEISEIKSDSKRQKRYLSDLTMGNPEGSKNNPGPTKCEAIGCDSKVHYRMTLMVGEWHSISIFLCKNCGPKFCKIDDSVQTNGAPGTSYDDVIACYRTANGDRS